MKSTTQNNAPCNILVIRFSAMGDVTMTVPVIRLLLHQYPNVKVTVLSAAFLAPLFDGIERCDFIPVNLKAEHKSIGGIYRLFKQLVANNQFDAIADLHNVLRTKLLTNLFRLKGYQTAVIDKGRADKKLLTRKKDKVLKQLPTSHERYADVFEELGFKIDLKNEVAKSFSGTISNPQTGKMKIGVAPFAQHAEKMYPIERMREVVDVLSKRLDTEIYLLGGKGIEAEILESWTNEKIFNLAGKQSFAEELKLISGLDMVISMDSANMHLASLFDVPVVSVWGATHRFAGFYGWQQPVENIVEVDLYCRPCSVFGNKPCYRGDHACMQEISPEMIVRKVEQVLAGKNLN